MNALIALLFLISLFGFFVFLVLSVVSLFTKKKLKRNFFCFLFSFVLFVVSVNFIVNDGDKNEKESGESSSFGQPISSINEASSSFADVSVVDSSKEQITEDEKENALKLDSAIWSRIIHAEECYNILLDSIDSNDLFSVYTACGNIQEKMEEHIAEIGKVSDSRAKDYATYAGMYFNQIYSISGNIRKYIDKQEIKYMEKAQNDIVFLQEFPEEIVTARFKFLDSYGFSAEEIIEIVEN